jgi:hypothetical protein
MEVKTKRPAGDGHSVGASLDHLIPFICAG